MLHDRQFAVHMGAYTLVTLTFTLSKPIYIDTGPCLPTAHERLSTGRNGALTH